MKKNLVIAWLVLLLVAISVAAGPHMIVDIIDVTTRLTIGGGSALVTSNQTGTGNLVLSTSPTIASPALTGSPTAATLAIGGGTTLATSNQTGTGSLVLQNNPTFLGSPVIPSATQPIGILTGGISGQCAVNIAGTWTAASCAGTAGTQGITTSPLVTVNANTTSPQTINSIALLSGQINVLTKTVHFYESGFVTPVNNTEAINFGRTFTGGGAYGGSDFALASGQYTAGIPIQVTSTGWCTVVATGVSGSFQCGGSALLQQSGITLVKVAFQPWVSGAGSVDLTGVVTLTTSINFGTASASNSAGFFWLVLQDI